MFKYNKRLFVLSMLMLIVWTTIAYAAQSNKNIDMSSQQWSIKNTIQSAFSYNPSLKQEQESTRIAEESVKQAKAGYLPEINVYGGTGGRTVLVPNE